MLLQYVGLAQGIQGTCVAISAVPGTSLRSSNAVRVPPHLCPLLHSSPLKCCLQLAGLQTAFGATGCSSAVQLPLVVRVHMSMVTHKVV